MPRHRIIICLALLLSLSAAGLRAAPVWQETKIDNLSYVTFDSFCEFYEFNKAAVPEQEPFTVSGVYGRLMLKANSREAWLDGRRVWLSFPFLRDEHGGGFVSRLDVIKLFDPLLRRAETAPRQKVLGVVIDPGHGGTDNGTRSRADYPEKIAALDTAKRLQAVLKARGVPTLMTRGEDVFLLLEDRCAIANRLPGWIFVSLHYNEAGPSASGVETYCLSPRNSPSTSDAGKNKAGDRGAQPGNKNDALNVILADSVHAELVKLYPRPADGDRGVRRARFVVLKGTEIPAILVEGGFLSNSGDARLITSGEYRQRLAESIARGIKNYMTLMVSPTMHPPAIIKPPVAVPVVPNLEEVIREVPVAVEKSQNSNSKSQENSNVEILNPKPAVEEMLSPEPEPPAPADGEPSPAEPEHPTIAEPEPAPEPSADADHEENNQPANHAN
ncbi:MAG: N-acetylmuramoyl-L-alanine amidase [Verrucomicrobiales bacterium]|jgi:N-acetylmuramoyl-L-alanine amidase|nr:N-acetylmuramoyl-L-alanine amidase [Verrucomicrobiales bacterium]